MAPPPLTAGLPALSLLVTITIWETSEVVVVKYWAAAVRLLCGLALAVLSGGRHRLLALQLPSGGGRHGQEEEGVPGRGRRGQGEGSSLPPPPSRCSCS